MNILRNLKEYSTTHFFNVRIHNSKVTREEVKIVRERKSGYTYEEVRNILNARRYDRLSSKQIKEKLQLPRTAGALDTLLYTWRLYITDIPLKYSSKKTIGLLQKYEKEEGVFDPRLSDEERNILKKRSPSFEEVQPKKEPEKEEAGKEEIGTQNPPVTQTSVAAAREALLQWFKEGEERIEEYILIKVQFELKEKEQELEELRAYKKRVQELLSK